MTFEEYNRATGLPQQAYAEWLNLPNDESRADVLEIMADPDELALILALRGSRILEG
jgi:hypothetical protein